MFKLLLTACALAVGLAKDTSRAAHMGYEPTELDNYVYDDDKTYHWEDLGIQMNGTSLDGTMSWTGHVLNMTSQTWLDIEQVNMPVWWHIMVVIVPDTLKEEQDFSMLWITGSSNDASDVIPKYNDEDIGVTAQLAMESGCIATALFQVPNEHIIFAADPTHKSRGEDAIIAFGWNYFTTIDTNPQYLLRLPMTKAAVRAMDTVEDFTYQLLGTNVTKWAVAGASKRGWTTWTTAAVDVRVQAQIPIVMDLMNIADNIARMYEAYGGWSFALKDYTDEGFIKSITNPNMTLLQDIVDPLSYIQRFTMPTLAVNSLNDEFFLPDNDHMWWDLMPAESNAKRLLLPNTEHSLATGIFEAIPAITVWFNQIQAGSNIQSIEWTIDEITGDITVVTPSTPTHIHMWYSESFLPDGRRDSRILNADDPCKCGFIAEGYCANLAVIWQSKTLHETFEGSNTYVAHVDPIEGKWTAIMVDVEFEMDPSSVAPQAWPIGHYTISEQTTQVSIVPNTYPFEDCRTFADGCPTNLV